MSIQNSRPALFFLVLFITMMQQAYSRQGVGSKRQWIDFNQNWQWHFAYDVAGNAVKTTVSLPHTWNAQEVKTGKINYRREAAVYQKKLLWDPSFAGKRLFLYFEGVNSYGELLVNQQYVGEHKGGYTAFCFEITRFVKPGKDNLVTVIASNAYRTDILPLSGDFNVYGGIHRPVSLIVADQNCISPLDYASPGVYISQKKVTEAAAQIMVRTRLSLQEKGQPVSVRTTVTDSSQAIVASGTIRVTGSGDQTIDQPFTIAHPVLWNAKAHPYLYHVKVELLQNGQPVDEVIQPMGLRYFRVDADKGFFLNGRHLDLHGFGLHEDVEGSGSAFTLPDYRRDMDLIEASGATSLRLTHYPHGNPLYDMCDENGIVLWSEIPLVGPGGYTGTGYSKSKQLEEQVKQVMTEMIRQHYNHPSICFWGLFNELKLDYDDPVPFIKELNSLVKQEDPYRLTTCATFLDKPVFTDITDLVAWNKYYGWYGGAFSDMGKWADAMHKSLPAKPIAISEYGSGASINQHTETPAAPEPTGTFHPEEWQTLYHEANWKQLAERPFVWGKYVWVLTDFGSSIRHEGDTAGINDKGLVSYDRKVAKDAFYFYKANWNPAPMLYITDRRLTGRTLRETTVKVFTNIAQAELFVNGRSMGTAKKDAYNTILWPGITLTEGENRITVKATDNTGKQQEDQCSWFYHAAAK